MRKVIVLIGLVLSLTIGGCNKNEESNKVVTEKPTINEENKDEEGKKDNIVEHSYKDEYIDKLDLIEEGVSDLDYLYESGITLDMNQAEIIQFERWDDILNEIYSLLERQLSEVEMKELTNKQIKWIEDRDITASNAANVYEDGSFATVEYNATLVRLTKERCYELVNTYMK